MVSRFKMTVEHLLYSDMVYVHIYEDGAMIEIEKGLGFYSMLETVIKLKKKYNINTVIYNDYDKNEDLIKTKELII